MIKKITIKKEVFKISRFYQNIFIAELTNGGKQTQNLHETIDESKKITEQVCIALSIIKNPGKSNLWVWVR